MADGTNPLPQSAAVVRKFTPRRAVSTKEAAHELGCSLETVYRYLRLGILRSSQPGSTGKHRRGGARHLIPIEDIERLMTVDARDDEGASDG